MAKIALLIGISEYLPEFPPLPSAVKDVEAMKEVLSNPEMGGFDEIKVLKNSLRQQIEEAIYELFANRKKDDVLLLYFSGHGVKSREGNLFLATPKTRKDTRGIVKRTAVAASVLQDEMNDSLSQRLVVILDCCYSGAFTKGMTAKGNENINIQGELGGKGRAILMSSSAVQPSFESKASELSIYTKYLVEGIKTGAADNDNNGKISADELHQYVTEKIHEESPAMTPQFSPVKEGYRIYLASCSQDDPKLLYRRKVQEILQKNNGEIDLISGFLLEELCKRYGLSDEEVKVIEAEEKEPYILLNNKLKRYEEIFSRAVEVSFPFTEKERESLQEIKSLLGLRDEDVLDIEERFLPESEELNSENFAEEKVVKTSSQNDEDVSDINIDKRFLEYLKLRKLGAKIFAEEKVVKTSSQNDEIELLSDKNVDYTKLRDFLANGKWKEADIETARCMLQVAERENQGYLEVEDIENFPCTDIRTIDQLWAKYSNGKFSFSVQKKIYQSLDKAKEYDKYIWEKYGEKVGWGWITGNKWLSYNELTFDLGAYCRGHLPGVFNLDGFVLGWKAGLCILFSRDWQVNDELILSEKEEDYTKLRDFLANSQWKEADEETANCMFKVAGREEKGCLEVEDIENFPCRDLRTIDQLWVRYSDGKFGFSVQKKVYQSLGGTKEYDKEIWEKFGEKVGWKKEGGNWLNSMELNWKKDTSSHCTGHLPATRLFSVGGGFISFLAQRLVDCNI